MSALKEVRRALKELREKRRKIDAEIAAHERAEEALNGRPVRRRKRRKRPTRQMVEEVLDDNPRGAWEIADQIGSSRGFAADVLNTLVQLGIAEETTGQQSWRKYRLRPYRREVP